MSTALEILPPEKPKPLKRITTIDDLWSVFVRIKGTLARNTSLEYMNTGRLFCKFMRDRTIDMKSITDWALFVQEGRQASTVNKINVKVKSFLRWLRAMNYTSSDLSIAIKTLIEPARREAKLFTEEEFNQVKEYCKGRNWCQVHLWLFILGYRTGMSMVDCCHLRWRDVHLNDNGPSYIDIYRIKTERLGQKALCQIPIIPFTDVHEWLLKLKAVEHLNYKRHDGITDYVHQDAPGFYTCSFQRIGQDFKNIFLRSGIAPGRSFKNLRNSFCSNLVNSGTQMALVCKMTGHNNVEMLLRYLKPDRRALQDGLNKAFQYAQYGN
jgi:integrase